MNDNENFEDSIPLYEDEEDKIDKEKKELLDNKKNENAGLVKDGVFSVYNKYFDGMSKTKILKDKLLDELINQLNDPEDDEFTLVYKLKTLEILSKQDSENFE